MPVSSVVFFVVGFLTRGVVGFVRARVGVGAACCCMFGQASANASYVFVEYAARELLTAAVPAELWRHACTPWAKAVFGFVLVASASRNDERVSIIAYAFFCVVCGGLGERCPIDVSCLLCKRRPTYIYTYIYINTCWYAFLSLSSDPYMKMLVGVWVSSLFSLDLILYPALPAMSWV